MNLAWGMGCDTKSPGHSFDFVLFSKSSKHKIKFADFVMRVV